LPLSLLMLCVAEWSLGYAIGLGTTSLPAKIFWAQVQYLGIVLIPVAWLAFSLQYTGYNQWLTPRNLVLLSIIPLITLLLVWTNTTHGLIWSQTRLVQQDGRATLGLLYGSWFWVQLAFAYLLVLIGTVLFIVEFVHRPALYRSQLGLVLLGLAFPLAGNVIRVARLSPIPDLDLTPFAFTLTGVVVAWGLFRFHLFDILPVAHSAVLKSMLEGVIVADQDDRVVDMNPAAERFTGHCLQATIGRTLDELFPQYPMLIEGFRSGEVQGQEITYQDGQSERALDVQMTTLRDLQAQIKGHLIVLRDVTERKAAEEYLRESEERFRQLSDAGFEGIVIHENGINLDCNQQCLQMSGYQNLEEVIGKSIGQFIAPEHLEEVRRQVASDYEGIYQTVAVRKDGTRYPIEVRGRKIRYQGREVRVAAIRDISLRLAAEEKLRQRAEELTSLYKLSLDLISPFEVSTLLERIVEKAVQLLEGGGGGLYLCDPQRREVHCVVSYKTPSDYRGTVLKYGEGAAGFVAATKKPLLIDDYRTWQGRAHVYDGDQPFRSVISVPMIWRDELIGVIHVLQFEEGRSFNQEHLELLSLFANQAAIAFENAEFVREIQVNARRMALLNDLTQVGISAPDLNHMLTRLVDRLGELFDANGAYITLWDEERHVPIPSAAYGSVSDHYAEIELEPGEANMTTAVLQAGRVLVVEDTSKNSYVSPRIAALIPTLAVMGLPLIADGRKLGAAFISYDQPRQFSSTEISLGEQAGAQVAMAIVKAQSLEAEKQRAEELKQINTTIQQLAITDDLTGLYNRRGLAEFGRREVERALRFSRPLSAIMLDIDRFKLVNDRYGHPLGDIVLRQLSECCRGNVRTIDIVGRYGGEEFLILLPEADLSHAVQVAERLRQLLAELDVQTPQADIRITVSAGVATLTPEVHTLEALIAQTDRELYRAKNAGRNRVAYTAL
jgi:diguanylate cyclase (GGDEF)-like protein/PAS domain S-box-containing protein